MLALSWTAHIRAHYEEFWKVVGTPCFLRKGPFGDLPGDFSILRFPPRPSRQMWTYATCGMSQAGDSVPIELHLFSPQSDESLIELLYAVVHYHRTGARLALNHTVNLGRSWLAGSQCSHGFISLPYLDGPKLERLGRGPSHIGFYWLIPVTVTEVAFMADNGVEALEQRFEQAQFDYVDPARKAVA